MAVGSGPHPLSLLFGAALGAALGCARSVDPVDDEGLAQFVRISFQMHDRDRNGGIDFVEFQNTRLGGEQATIERFRSIDDDGSGAISPSEAFQFLREQEPATP